jgi:hypothetical protein
MENKAVVAVRAEDFKPAQYAALTTFYLFLL